MKDIRPALRALLLGDVTVSGLVGGIRIHSVRLPQGQKTASIVYNRITEQTDYHYAGGSGLAQARFQVDSWATTQDAAVVLANAAYDRLSGFGGILDYGSNSPQDQILINAIFMDQGREDFDSVAEMYRMSRDYIIWYAER
jgi:hypothetical protein